MKPTLDFDDTLFDNMDQFQDPFFKRFTHRPATQPLQLNDRISKNYLFPTFYGNVRCAIGVFMCNYNKAQSIMLDPKVKPVRMTKGRSLIVFSCYEYRNVMHIPAYNEIAMTIPVMVNPGINVPVLPMITNFFKEFGYYVFYMPVTSEENRIRGNKIWGLPKVTQEISLVEKDGHCITTAKESSGETYFELSVPTSGKPTAFDVSSNLYSRLGNQFLQSETNFKGTFNMTKYLNLLWQKDLQPKRTYLKIGDSPSTKILRHLEIEAHPFQLRYCDNMNSCFDLPNTDFQSPIKFK